ncbi:amidohydrolase [Anaerofilum sp. BX8]|uniref:Amidohydrolase n=1 Tax=Anaerofilum hominis TaxID=2763016 RepID=A0A923KXF0_9FIRM|nr:amidohydrolase [Anaerofilum hominis]MBC5580494.1 amidohydrolase [Anaerofilum hominis]
MNVRELAEKYESYIIERRRYYHTCPELSEHEVETAKSLKADLEAMGVEVEMCKNCNGVVGTIKGGKPGKTVALRADIDALSVVEETGLPFASKNEGAMHACGHDNHMAMLLGGAKILTEIKDQLPGTVKILFQPAEEVATGANAMIAEGVLEGVDAIYGAHIWGDFDAPLIDASAGNRMACCDGFTIEVEGVSTHGSSPHLGTDGIVAAAAIIQELQSYVSRNNNPLNPCVVTVGTINGGQRFNIIANKVVLEGTVRTFSRETLATIQEDMQRIVSNTAAAFGATANVTKYSHMTPPLINDNEDLNKIAQDAVIKLYGEEALGHLPTMMGSEDYAFFMEKVPGIYCFLGSRDAEHHYINHHEKYDVPEDVLKRGAAMYAQFAFDFLEANA